MEEWGFAAGDEVELRGLSKLELNGQRGTVLSLESPEQARQLGRLAVMMHSGKQLSLKVSNLLKVTHRSHGSACDLSLHSRRKLVSTPVNHAPQLAVMTFNLQHLANFPKDPSIARRRLMELTSGRPPDLIAIQEGLEGIDLLAQVGYSKLISSAVKAVPLREALYGDEAALEALPAIAHESLMVNEFYLRSDEECAWQLEGTGVEQISSAVSLGDDPIVPRSVIWAKLCLKGTEGPCVFVMNTQLSGSRIEDERFLSELADERSRQVARCADLASQHTTEDDLVLLVGDFGAVSGPFGLDVPQAAKAPLNTLEDLGWSLAYDESVVPASCLFGFLSDFMATNRKVLPLSVEAMATANVIGEAAIDVPLSDHQAIKAVFSMQPLLSTAPSEASQDIPVLGFGSHFLPEDLQERLSDEEYYQRVDELTREALEAAFSCGVRLLDSGNRHMNQQSLGRALETAISKGVLKRSEVFLCGRIYKCKDREQIRGEVDMLLSELKVDYVDVLVADCPPEQVPSAWPFFEEVIRDGRARCLGVANFDLLGPKVCTEVFRSFLSRVKVPPAVMALEVHPLNSNIEMCDLCETLGIQVLAYAPLGSPAKMESFMKVLTKSDAREMRRLLKVPELPQLEQIAQRHGTSTAQVALRWNLQRGHIVIPKSWNPSHIEENTDVFDFSLSNEEMAKITKLHKGVRSERFFQASFTASKALPRMTRDAFDECQEILKKIRGPTTGTFARPSLDGPVPLPMEVAQRGGHDASGKVDWEKLGFHRPVEEEPGFWRRMGLATGKGIDGGKGKGQRFPWLKDGLPVGGKGVPHPAMVGYR